MLTLLMLYIFLSQIPFIAMYRKESCPSLLKGYYASEKKNEDEGTPKMRWYKVTINY